MSAPAYHIIPVNPWEDYELLDCGNLEKLERFGKYILRRPEPQAVWEPALTEGEWQKLAHASFVRSKGEQGDKGRWEQKPGMPGQWFISCNAGAHELKFRLGLTAFKHVGIFPEQKENWDFICKQVQRRGEKPQVLNLFAYTGGASLAACAAGTAVTHVDSVKQVITWSNENMAASGLDHIRWMVDDAFKFCEREVRRGKKYQGIILDPPAYGRGPDGEKWLLEKQINSLMALISQLLEPGGFLVLNLYSMGFSALIARNLVQEHFGKDINPEIGELCLPDRHGRLLPLGVFLRFG